MGLDQILKDVLIVALPRILVLVGIVGVPGLLDLREGQGDLAIRTLRRGPQPGGPRGVGALQPGPAQPAGGVLMVEEVRQPSWPIGPAAAVGEDDRGGEVRMETGREITGQRDLGRCGAAVACQEQVLGESDAVARLHGKNLAAAVGVEGDQRDGGL